MNLRFAANASFFGARRDRFSQYQSERDLIEKLALISSIDGVTGVELKYPRDFDRGDAAAVRDVGRLIADHGLTLSAVNVDTKAIEHFRYGALSARHSETRAVAVSRLQAGMDIAAELGAEIVTTCPLAEGYDYPFQIDYGQAWDNLIDSVRTAATHRQDITLVLEYQPHEPHAHILLGNVGKMLHLCAEVTASDAGGTAVVNVGANLDVGHSFAAGESPAEAAALLARKGWLRYVHTNDNTGDGGDWDMISGSVHFWGWLELLYTLDRVGYDGWFSGDIQPKHFSPVAAYRTNMHMVKQMAAMLDRVGPTRIASMIEVEGHTPALYEMLMGAIG